MILILFFFFQVLYIYKNTAPCIIVMHLKIWKLQQHVDGINRNHYQHNQR